MSANPGKHHARPITTSQKGEEATRKKSKILLVFRVSKSASRNSL
jgi:hypothetical protein